MQRQKGIMPYREFVDSANVHWKVWETVPLNGKVLSKGYENGWLTFDSGQELRRLGPVPDKWEDLPDAKLRSLLKEATIASKTPARGIPAR